MRDARRLAAARADEHHPPDRQGLGDLEDAALVDLGSPVRGRGRLARLGVPLGDVQPFDDDLHPAGARAAAEDAAGGAG